MNDINFFDLNCMTRYHSNAMAGPSGPDGQNIPCHSVLLINEKYVFVNANTCTF